MSGVNVSTQSQTCQLDMEKDLTTNVGSKQQTKPMRVNNKDTIEVSDEDHKEDDVEGKRKVDPKSSVVAGKFSNLVNNNVNLGIDDNGLVVTEDKGKAKLQESQNHVQGNNTKNLAAENQPNSTKDGLQFKQQTYVSNNNPLKVSNNFEPFRLNNSKNDYNRPLDNRNQNNFFSRNPNQNKFPTNNITNPPNPMIPHTLVTRLRSQEDMKVATIDISPTKLQQYKVFLL